MIEGREVRSVKIHPAGHERLLSEQPVLDIGKVEQFYKELQTEHKRILRIMKTGNEECHVIAGDILSPETTQHIAGEIVGFIKSL